MRSRKGRGWAPGREVPSNEAVAWANGAKDLFAVETTRLEFFMEFCYWISVAGVALLLCAAVYFRGQRGEGADVSAG